MIQKFLTWITGVIEMVFFAGAFYGWANIYPVLEDEGYFTEGCQNGHTNHSTTSVDSTCKHQAESLALVFTIGGAVGLFANFFTGALLDSYGMWFTRTVLINLSVVAYILVAISSKSTSFVLYLALPIISSAGFGTFIITTQMTNLYPKLRASYSFSLFGGFSSASTVYLIFNKLYYSGIDLNLIIYGYIGICLLMNIRTFLLTPKRSIPYNLPPSYKYGYKELCSEGSSPAVYLEEENKESVKKDNNFNPDGMTFKQCLCKAYTYTAILNYTVMHLLSTFYMSSLSMYLKSFLGFTKKEDINYYANMFGVIQCCSIAFAPLNGFLIDYCRRKFAKNTSDRFASIKACAIGFALGNTFLVAMVIFCLIPNAKYQIAAMLMQVLSRICFFGVWTMFLCEVYPTNHYGKMFGVSTCVVGISMILQYPLTLILTRVVNRNFTVLNSFFLALACTAWVHPLYIWYYVSAKAKKSNRQPSKETHVNVVSLDDEV